MLITFTSLISIVSWLVLLSIDNVHGAHKHQDFAESVGAIFKQTSAKSGVGIREFFMELAEKVVPIYRQCVRAVTLSDLFPLGDGIFTTRCFDLNLWNHQREKRKV